MVHKGHSISDSSSQYAIKIINRNNHTNPDLIANEIEISKTLLSSNLCKNLIHCYDVFESNNEVAFVMEYIDGDLMSKLNGTYSATKIDSFLSQFITSVKFLHSIGVVHRDIKPNNILVSSDGTVKLIDFGLSKVISYSETVNECYGSLLFTSPEILLCNEYNSKVDVWSLGVLAFYFLFGIMPFNIRENDINSTIAKKIIINDVVFPFNRFDRDRIDIKIRRLIKQSLCKSSNERPFINDILY